MVWGSLIGAGASIAGGLIGKKGTSRKRERDSARIASEEALIHARKAPSAAVEGFKAAGIHPLFGLTGTSGMTAMPSYSTPGGSSGPDFGAVGQGIARAASALTGREERAVAAQSAKLGLEHQQLENEFLRTQIQHMNAPGTHRGLSGSSFHPGQADVVNVPKEVIANTGQTEKGQRAMMQKFNFKGMPIWTMSDDMANAGNDEGPISWGFQAAAAHQMLAALLRSGVLGIRDKITGKERR